MRLFLVAALGLSAALSATAQQDRSWGYFGKNGPVNWGKLNPAYRECSAGHEQSPIDIRGAHLNSALPPIEFHYRGGPVTLENTGQTIVVHVKPGSYIVYDGVRFDLDEFEFHHPSENAVHGKLTDLDVELVHKSADGKLAVVAVRFSMERGESNAMLAALWPHLPNAPGATATIPDVISAGGFLPADRAYWTFAGSLTTPPCTEGVRWLVFEEPLSMSIVQLRQFTALFRMNSRPLQDPHRRRIEANE